jgi:6-phosphogluconolactonase (cycloisomerase 2 family)
MLPTVRTRTSCSFIRSIRRVALSCRWVTRPVLGIKPRDFCIDPTGKFLVVAIQDSDNLVIFQRDLETGALTPTGKQVEEGSPVCLQVVPAP